ncbi:MAG: thermonuclease family protein [Acidimicrobiaceae bacterium]|nr:thermonuclease family protein [Acidimicrobiaceae bacterium]
MAVLMLAALSCTGTDDARTAGTGAPRASPTGLIPNATISEVVDGDTVIADVGGSRETVRLIGIDTPESVARNRPNQCYGAQASAYLKSLLPEGTSVTLILDEEARDQYDRLLAYMVRSHDDLFINLDLVARGYAGTLSYPPNTHHEQLLDSAEKRAMQSGLGLWGVCGNPDVPLE